MKTAEQILLDAATLIRKGWTRGAFARRADTTWVASASDEAVCWCMEGAVVRASQGADLSVLRAVHARLEVLLPDSDGWRGIVRFNDIIAKDAEEVASMLEKAART